MRINQYVARATGLSRRAADSAIAERRVRLNDQVAAIGSQVGESDVVTLDTEPIQVGAALLIALNKPAGYVSSRRQQGATPTIYALLPERLHQLKPIGRLDSESSGLLMLTNDGTIAQQLQHPSQSKWKRYQVELDRPLQSADAQTIKTGVKLKDGISTMEVSGKGRTVEVKLQEGRNRQIRRTFGALGYRVVVLHRDGFGPYELGDLPPGKWREESL
jgi:23S rRNA pseudouridine2605 synthase